jgi:hypothetical protein
MGWYYAHRCQRCCYTLVQHNRWEQESTTTCDNEAEGYRTLDEEVKELLECIRHYNAFSESTGIKSNSKFRKMFTDSEVLGLHIWMGAMGNCPPPDHLTVTGGESPEERQKKEEELQKFEERLNPMFKFLSALDTQERQQIWANVPNVLKAGVLHCTSIREFNQPEVFLLQERTNASAKMRDTIARHPEIRVLEGKHDRIQQGCQNFTCDRCCAKLKKRLLRKKTVFCLSFLVASVYISILAAIIFYNNASCCKPSVTFAKDPIEVWTKDHLDKFDPYKGKLQNRGIGEHAKLDVALCVSVRNSTNGGKPLTEEQQADQLKTQKLSVLTPKTSCPATCEETYFPKYVLRRASEIKTRAEYYTCTQNNHNSYRDILAVFLHSPTSKVQTFWSHSCGDHVCEESDHTRPFSCVRPKPLGINQAFVTENVVEKDEQVWFNMTVSEGITYEITIKIDNDHNEVKTGYIGDSVVCIYNDWKDQSTDIDGAGCNNNADTLGLGSRLIYGGAGKTDAAAIRQTSARYVAVYGRRNTQTGSFKIRVATACSMPGPFADNGQQRMVKDVKNGTSPDGSLAVLGGHGYYVNDEVDDSKSVTACAQIFANATEELSCKYDCVNGYKMGDKIECIVHSNLRMGTLTNGSCTKKPTPEPEPQPEPMPKPEPKPRPKP